MRFLFVGREPATLHPRYGGGLAFPGDVVDVPEDAAEEAALAPYLLDPSKDRRAARKALEALPVSGNTPLVRQALDRRGLSVSGSAAQMRDRLLDYAAGKISTDPVPDAPVLEHADGAVQDVTPSPEPGEAPATEPEENDRG